MSWVNGVAEQNKSLYTFLRLTEIIYTGSWGFYFLNLFLQETELRCEANLWGYGTLWKWYMMIK